jgi:hypothetical protein
MKITDIAHIKVNWMETWGNDPGLTFVLKRDRKLTPWEQFRFRQSGSLFYAEHESEIRFISHDRNDHNGFGGAIYTLHMADDWDVSTWRPCSRTERRWMSGGQTMEVSCQFNADTRILSIKGPWHSGATGVTRAYKPVMEVGTLEGPNRETVRAPEYYHRARKRGRAYDGCATYSCYTLDFVQEAIDRLAPHLELYEGDFGWYPVRKGDTPKNPRRNVRPHESFLSDEQMSAVFF